MSYKVAPSLSSYTQEELISSKAGPQGTATYDEMEYDPIAKERLSAEAVSKVDCVNLISKKAAFTGKDKNFYRVSFRDASQYSNFATPEWATRAAQTMGIKYYQTPNCKIVMGYKNGKWEIQAVLVPNTENMTKQKALKIGNHMQDRIEREGQWAKKKCREDEIVEIYEAEEYGAETEHKNKKWYYYNLDRGVYSLPIIDGKIVGFEHDRQKEMRAGFPNANYLLSNTKQAWEEVTRLNEEYGAETFGADSKPYRVDVSRSTNKEKKLMAVFEDKDGKKIKTTHFGARGMSDYTKHGDKERMERYNTRHRKNENWNQPMTAGSLSKYILWNTPSLQGSFNDYKRRFGLKGDLKVSRSAENFGAEKIKRRRVDAQTRKVVGRIIADNIGSLFYDIAYSAFNPKYYNRPITQKAWVDYIREECDEEWPIDTDIYFMRMGLVDEGYDAENWSAAELVQALWPECKRQIIARAKRDAPEIVAWAKKEFGDKYDAETFGAENSVCRCGKGIANPKCKSCDSPLCSDCDYQYANNCIECFFKNYDEPEERYKRHKKRMNKLMGFNAEKYGVETFDVEDEPLFPGLNCSHCGSDEDTYYGEPLTHTPDGIPLSPNDVESKLHIWCDGCGEASPLNEYGAETLNAEGGQFRTGAMYGAGAVVGITGATLALGAIFSLIGRRS